VLATAPWWGGAMWHRDSFISDKVLDQCKKHKKRRNQEKTIGKVPDRTKEKDKYN
jgi:hypothetical protein